MDLVEPTDPVEPTNLVDEPVADSVDGSPDDPMDRSANQQTAEPLTRVLQRLNDRIRDFDRRHPLVWDLHVTSFWLVVALVDYLGGGWRNLTHNPDLPAALMLAMSLGFSVPLLWRRGHPAAVFLAMVPVAAVNAWTGALLQAAVLQLVPLYHVALRLPLRNLWWATALSGGPVVLATALDGFRDWNQQIVPDLMTIALVAVLGVTVRTRRNYTEALQDRARRLEIERDQQARLATAAERARIAREMHDIIGHNLSVITSLADGGRYAAAKSPERAAQALDAIADTSRLALDELRRLLDVLRDHDHDDESGPGIGLGPGLGLGLGLGKQPGSAGLAPQPSLTDLDRLIAGVRAAGLPVRMTVRGDSTHSALAPGRQLTVYRVIQEALTNSLKHAGPQATSEILLSYEGQGAVTVTVTDTGHGGPPPVSADGRGLPGMRERAALYGGTLEAGPRPAPDAGWQVHLHIPGQKETSAP